MKERTEAQMRLIDLNRQFLAEIEAGKGWAEVKYILEEMKLIAKQLDGMPATVVSFDNYNLDNQKLNESAM
jgi:hypothetical protein